VLGGPAGKAQHSNAERDESKTGQDDLAQRKLVARLGQSSRAAVVAGATSDLSQSAMAVASASVTCVAANTGMLAAGVRSCLITAAGVTASPLSVKRDLTRPFRRHGRRAALLVEEHLAGASPAAAV